MQNKYLVKKISQKRNFLEIYWSDNVKSRTVNNEIPNQYQINQNSKKLIRSQIEINNYYKSKLEK